MDLGIRGRKAIVCGSSQGLGKGCALALAQAGVSMAINGRNRPILHETAEELRKATGVEVTPVVADINTPEGQAALLAACPEPDILINNNGGPPFRDFRDLDRAAMLTGVAMNMITPIELIQKVIDAMAARGFGRIVNITSITVKMPIAGLDLSSGARAGLTAFIAGVARSVADRNVTINNLLPGYFDTERLREGFTASAKRAGSSEDAIAVQWKATVPARRFGTPSADLRFPMQCARRLHHWSEHSDGWRVVPERVLSRPACGRLGSDSTDRRCPRRVRLSLNRYTTANDVQGQEGKSRPLIGEQLFGQHLHPFCC
jgi:3-oxoacyl-[acyl-carrier protein] reductase